MAEMTTSAETPTGSKRADWKVKASARSAPPQGGGAVYGLGMIGALVYFLGTADTGKDYLAAVGKAMVWPAILVYLAFKKLGD